MCVAGKLAKKKHEHDLMNKLFELIARESLPRPGAAYHIPVIYGLYTLEVIEECVALYKTSLAMITLWI